MDLQRSNCDNEGTTVRLMPCPFQEVHAQLYKIRWNAISCNWNKETIFSSQTGRVSVF